MTNSLQKGSNAPDFHLPRDGGEQMALKDFSGQNLVLYFYPKDDTPGCTAEAIDFNGLKKNFADVNTVIVGVSPDPVNHHDKFKVKYDLDFPLIADEATKMLQDYGVWVEKSMYGRKYMGVERSTVLIDAHGKIVEIWRKVSVPGHAQAVLAAAQALNGTKNT